MVGNDRYACEQLAESLIMPVRTGEPLLRLGIPDAACSCIEWMTGSRIAVGLSNGEWRNLMYINS